MHKVIQRIQQLKVILKLEQIYNVFIILIIVIILGLSSLATYRSISPKQLQNVYQIAQQSNYVDTQKIALALLVQDHVHVGQYLKLMLALQMEQKKAKQLPAISVEEH